MKKLFWILGITFLVFTVACTSQESDNTSVVSKDSLTAADTAVFYKHLKGKMNNEIAFTMDLTCNGTLYVGTYYYDKVGTLISLSGYRDNSGMVQLTEMAESGKTGVFKGKLLGDVFAGTWTSADTKTNYSFSVKEDYLSGSMRFDAFYLNDSTRLLDSTVKNSPIALYSLYALMPVSANGEDFTVKFFENFSRLNFGKSANNTITYDEQMKKSSKDYFDEYKDVNKDYAPEYGLSSYSWEYNSTLSVLYNENRILSLSKSFYEFTGGAHGQYQESLVVFDLKKSDTLKIEDLFKPGFEKTLANLIEKNIRKQLKIKKNESLTDYGFFVENGVKHTRNFYLTRGGIGFVYNPYEIASYANGKIEVVLTFAELKPILKSNLSFIKDVPL